MFRPEVDGRKLDFRLVGAVFYNALLEDQTTGTWWWQATGKAAAGPLLGKTLGEVPFEQMRLAHWLELHPDSEVMLPDEGSAEGYKLYGFDGIDSRRADVNRDDQLPGEDREWVVGVTIDGVSRAVPMRDLQAERVVQAEVGPVPIAVHLREDWISFRVWDRRLDGQVLDLRHDPAGDGLLDAASGTRFDFSGQGLSGPLEGCRLARHPGTQEYWHSFRRFYPGAERVGLAAAPSPAPDTR